jgi:D-alanyl-D-alanine carboxypeptidase
MRRDGARARARAVCVALLTALLVSTLAGCARTAELERTDSRPAGTAPEAAASSEPPSPRSPATTPGAATIPSGPATPSTRAADPSAYAVPDPGPLRKSLLTADVLITSSTTIPASVRSRVARVRGVSAAMPMSLASMSVNGRTLSVGAADPGEFRRFTPVQSAQSDAVWSRVAGGEVAVDPSLPRRLEQPAGYLRLGTSPASPVVHIGAYAPIVKQISAVVDYKRARQLGMPRDNALLVSTGTLTPSAVTGRLKKAVGAGATLQTLALEFNVDVLQTAVLSGASVSSAVGTFTYTPHADGTVTPDPSWVRSYIRTERVPIIGNVTCNKGMIPQLRAALTEVVRQGLASKIHPGEYAGCYVPRYIARDPAKGLSLHSWGIAVDLNVPGNQRGTVGQMDRRVVGIFKKWGFAWGGDWSYTDPMHFEMAEVVRTH